MAKTLANIYDPNHVSNFARNNQYMPHVSVCAQKEIFSQTIASPSNQEPHHKSWESAIRGNDDMMNKLHDTVNDMLASKNKPDTADTNKPIVFSFFHTGKITSLDAQELRHYSQTMIELKTLPSTDGSGLGTKYPILQYYNKDGAVFMPRKYILRALWHHVCEVLFQAPFKLYSQPSGAQLPG